MPGKIELCCTVLPKLVLPSSSLVTFIKFCKVKNNISIFSLFSCDYFCCISAVFLTVYRNVTQGASVSGVHNHKRLNELFLVNDTALYKLQERIS